MRVVSKSTLTTPVLLEEHLSKSSESGKSSKAGRDSETNDSYWKG